MRITNIVVQGDLGCRIDLKQLVLKLSNVRYDPNRFSGIVWMLLCHGIVMISFFLSLDFHTEG
jgi:TATA-box binding protein (TBP) (component of TFIID and TFIIIB)